MPEPFSIPEEYELSFRRLLPYLAAPLQNKPEVLSSLFLYLKLGGEKLARVAIDALNVSQRLEDAELIKRLREEAMRTDLEESDAESDDDASDEDEDEDEDEGEGEGEGDASDEDESDASDEVDGDAKDEKSDT